MENRRSAVVRRWETRAAGWAPVLREPTPRAALPPDDAELPALSLVASKAESPFWRALLAVWTRIGDGLDLDALAEAARRGSALDADRLLHFERVGHLMEQVLVPRIQTLYRHGVDHGAGELRAARVPVKQLGVSLDEPYRQAARWAREHAGDLITEVTRDQVAAVSSLIARANAQGIDPDTVARRLRRTIGLRSDQEDAAAAFEARLRRQGVSDEDVERRTNRYREALQRQRARLIARTELIRAANAGQQQVWDQAVRQGSLPRNVKKKWIVTPDERLCPRCEALGEQEPVPVGQEFAPGVMFPGLHPNCRCAMGLVLPPASAQVPELPELFPMGPPVDWMPGEVLPMPRGSGIGVEDLGRGLDPLAKRVAKRSAKFWRAVAQIGEGPRLALRTDVGRKAAGRRVEEFTEAVAATLRGPGSRLTNIDVIPYAGSYAQLGHWADYDPARKTIRYCNEASDAIALALQAKEGALKRFRTGGNFYRSITAVVHELTHDASGASATPFGHLADQFLEEGTTHLRAERVTGALVFHGLKGKARARALAEMAPYTVGYVPFTQALRWFERTVNRRGGPLLHAMAQEPRRSWAATQLRKWLTRTFTARYGREGGALTRALDAVNGLTVSQLVNAWRTGEWASYAAAPMKTAEEATRWLAGVRKRANQLFPSKWHRPSELAMPGPPVPRDVLTGATMSDRLARHAARGSEGFWMDLAVKLDYTPLPPKDTPGYKRASGELVRWVMERIGDVVTGGGAPLSRVLFRPWAGPVRWAWYDRKNRTIKLSDRFTEQVIEWLTQKGPLSVRNDAKAYETLKTLIHEVLHPLTPGHISSFATATDFLNEGPVELRADRIAAALVAHGLSRASRQAMREALAGFKPSYQPFVHMVRWAERNWRPDITRLLHTTDIDGKLALVRSEMVAWLRKLSGTLAGGASAADLAGVEEFLGRVGEEWASRALMEGWPEQWQKLASQPGARLSELLAALKSNVTKPPMGPAPWNEADVRWRSVNRTLVADRWVKAAARGAGAFWRAVAPFKTGQGVDPMQWSSSRKREVVQAGVESVIRWLEQTLGRSTRTETIRLYVSGMKLLGTGGRWHAGTLSLDSAYSNRLLKLFTGGEVGPARSKRELYKGLKLLIHELLHGLDPEQVPVFPTTLDLVVKEAAVEARARRMASALIGHGLLKRERRQVAAALAPESSDYALGVEMMRWAERHIKTGFAAMVHQLTVAQLHQRPWTEIKDWLVARARRAFAGRADGPVMEGVIAELEGWSGWGFVSALMNGSLTKFDLEAESWTLGQLQGLVRAIRMVPNDQVLRRTARRGPRPTRSFAISPDRLAMRAARNSKALWRQVDALAARTWPAIGSPEEEKVKHKVVEQFIRLVGQALEGRIPTRTGWRTVDLGKVKLRLWFGPKWVIGGDAGMDPKTLEMAVSDQTSQRLYVLLKKGGLRWIRRWPGTLDAFNTVVHELTHAMSLSRLQLGGVIDQFLREGLNQVRAERITSALAFHGLKVKDRRRIARVLQKTLPTTYSNETLAWRWAELRFHRYLVPEASLLTGQQLISYGAWVAHKSVVDLIKERWKGHVPLAVLHRMIRIANAISPMQYLHAWRNFDLVDLWEEPVMTQSPEAFLGKLADILANTPKENQPARVIRSVSELEAELDALAEDQGSIAFSSAS